MLGFPGCPRELSGLALVVALQALPVRPPVGQAHPVFRSEIGLVVLQATVNNRRGELITNIDRAAFTVYENGKPQAITLFGRDDVPVSLGIAIDNSGSMRKKREKVEAAALALVQASNPQDEVFILNFGDKPRIDVPFTRDRAVLEKGIARVDSIGGTAMRDAVEMGEGYLSEHAANQRKVLLVVSDGNDNASAASPERVHQEAERSATVIYAIGLLADDDPAKAERARHELDELTETTGGLAYYPQSVDGVAGVAIDLVRQIRSQYTIGYSPSNQALDGSYRKLRVA